jgi:mono/diheme cytochrome c family protein
MTLTASMLALIMATTVGGAQETGSVWDGVYTDGQAMRGEIVYRRYCLACHGAGLEGADMTPALAGGAFTANWNDLTLGDLFERIRTTMPMDRPGVLSRQQNADVMAYLLQGNQWPAGTTELRTELAPLKAIRIESTKR